MKEKDQVFTKTEARRQLEAARGDIALIMARKHEEIRELDRVMGGLGVLWEGVLGEDAPEYRVEVRAS